jgi:FkbM family methyltransferase
MISLREKPVRRRTEGETVLSRLAVTLPVTRRLWLSPTAHRYRRAHRILKRAGEAGAFAVRETHADKISADASVYTLRDSGLRVALRHGSSDVWVLEEIFDRRCYALPEPACTILSGLGRPPQILDLGGHIGLFGLYMLGLCPEADITSVEPDPQNLRLLDTCIGLNGRKDRWSVVRACAGVADGQANFVSCEPSYGDFARSHVAALSGPQQLLVPVRDVFALVAGVDLLKMDIEGSEWEILQDPRLAEVGPAAVVLEYHPYRCPEADALSCATKLLTEAGYVLGPHARSADGEGILWAWSRNGVTEP